MRFTLSIMILFLLSLLACQDQTIKRRCIQEETILIYGSGQAGFLNNPFSERWRPVRVCYKWKEV